jgi:predicted DNA-binding transcriptional regulator AlpA
MKETYLTAEQIAKALRISKEKVSLLAKKGLFPKPLELHTGAVLWSEKEVKVTNSPSMPYLFKRTFNFYTIFF